MKEKIKKALNIFDNIDFDVWFDETIGCGIVTLHRSCVTSTILDELTTFVELVAITCTAPHCYKISFLSK